MKRVVLLLLLLVVAGAGYYYISLRNSPTAALLQAAEAIRTHDLARFERFVDVDALTSGIVDDVASRSSLLSGLVPGGGLLLQGGIGLMKPQLTKAAHAEVRRYVATGSLEAAQAAAPKRFMRLSFLSLAGRVVGPESRFKGIKYATEKGDDAWVGIEFTQPRYDTTMVAEIQLHKQPDGHWQAKRITNSGAMLQQVAREEGAHLLR